MSKMTRGFCLFLFHIIFVYTTVLHAADLPVYPVPQEIELTASIFDLKSAEIITFGGPDKEMTDMAYFLSSEIAARYQISLTWRKSEGTLSEKPPIMLGLLSDPEITAFLTKAGMKPASEWSKSEAYSIAVTSSSAVIAGYDLRGLFYGIQTFIQLVKSSGLGQGQVKGCHINDRPFKPVRGVHVYLPARKDIPFFKNFIRAMAHFKINTLIIEVGGGMRLDRHPEINIAWEHFCRSFYDMGDPVLKYGEQVPLGPRRRFQASVHTELGGGSWLTKEEVKGIVDFARRHYMNVIPEIQGLTHSYYLVLAHRDIAEIPEAEWPDSYDPTNPGSYDLMFDVIDEYLEVFQPEWVHIGRDEWRAGIKGETGKLFAEDVLKIYRYLTSRGVKTMMWADHFIRGHNLERRGAEPPEEGVWYSYPSTEGAAEIISAETKDILMFNWSWGVVETAVDQIKNYGWKQVFGNFDGAAQYEKWPELLSRNDVLGAEMSTWCLANEFSFGQNGSILNMLLSQHLLWSAHSLPLEELYENLAVKMPAIRELLSGDRLPSLEVRRKRTGYEYITVDISPQGNSGRNIGKGFDLNRIPSGKIKYTNVPFLIGAGDKAFAMVSGHGKMVTGITVESSAASMLFLHVCTGKGKKRNTYFSNYPEDTAELLGYYRIHYTDGSEATVPIRFGRNISHYGGDFSNQLYFAHTVNLEEDQDGIPFMAFAYEWINPRPNKQIRSVDLVGVDAESGACPVLLALTIVKTPFIE